MQMLSALEHETDRLQRTEGVTSCFRFSIERIVHLRSNPAHLKDHDTWKYILARASI
jgi:hypothetical protein